AKRLEDQEEGEEEAVEAVAVAEVVLQPSPVKHVTSALGQRAEVKGMGKAMFKGAYGKMVGLKNCVKGPEEESVGEEERRRFHSLVGSLMYAAVNTRPDVAFATG
ncbi:unnamed protein product, partial [Closterium sp. NIES-53]